MSAREKILARIKNALYENTEKPIAKPDFSAKIYVQNEQEDIAVVFAENFKKTKTEFFYCENLEAFLASLKAWLVERKIERLGVWEAYLQELLNLAQIEFIPDDADFQAIEAGLTLCEYLIARTGSVMVSAKQSAGRRLGIYPPIHIVVGFTSQLTETVKEAMIFMQEKYFGNFPSMLSVISGPSQTADIEKTLVLGAHGPKELILFLIDDLANDNPA